MPLYPFQNEGVNNIREAFKTNLRILYVAPTGSGKTITFSDICAKAIEKGRTVLVLSDRIEIFKQNLKAITKHQIAACKVDASNKRIDGQAKLFFGMVETFKRRMKLFKDIHIDLIIVDEAHKQVYYKVFDAFPTTKVLGVTATPVGKKLHLYYNTLITSIDIPELIEQGFLCRCKHGKMDDGDFSDLKVEGEDFSEASNFAHFNKSKLYDGVVSEYVNNFKGKKALVFCVNIEHSEQTAKAFNSVGIKAYCLTSKTSDTERIWILNEYGKSFFVLVNANILIAGFDDPSIEVIMVNRATASLTAWLQMGGRGGRQLLGGDGKIKLNEFGMPVKPQFYLIDFGGNIMRLGLWSQPRTWELSAPKKRKKKGLGVAPVRECKSCGAMLPAQSKTCEFCGHVMTDKEKELLKGQLTWVNEPAAPKVPERLVGLNLSECSVEDIIELEKVKALKSTFVWRVMRSRGEADIIKYANAKGYKNGWIQRQILALDAEFQERGKPKEINFKVHENLLAVKN
jgi:superfamily II DNA or RNA helicase/predicted nucleic acid-binding Zn ribbon protein